MKEKESNRFIKFLAKGKNLVIFITTITVLGVLGLIAILVKLYKLIG